jgi:hypothetical protein
MASSNDLGVCLLSFFESGDVALGDDQHMRGGLRIDVFKREHVRVFVNFLGGNLAPDNPAEKAIAGVRHDLASF